MSESARDPDPREVFRRYAGLITAALRGSGASVPIAYNAEDPRLVQVERGVVFPELLLDAARAREPVEVVQRLIAASEATRLARLVIVDRTGHSRPVYRPLL